MTSNAGTESDLQGAYRLLRDRLYDLAVGRTQPPVIRIEASVPDTDPLVWLDAQLPGCCLYWRGREDSLEIAGAGCADNQPAENGVDLENLLTAISERTADSRVRYFGGLRFDSEYSSGANKLWDGFAPAHFVLPRVELRREPHSCTLVLNVLREELRPDRIGPVAEQLKRLGLPAESTATGPVTIRDRVDLPDSKGWREAVEHGLELCSGGPLRKIVLARRSDLNLSNPISPWSLLRMLRKESVGVFMFGFEDVDGQTFIGATPERLYQRESRRIKSEAVAGTRPRGSDEDSDRKLADELMASEKDRREHGHVVDRMREAFNLLCDSFEIQTAPRISSFARVQHLVTRGDGKLKSGVDDAAILSALHPSPAVAGTPTDLAVTHLREIEPFDRGWYAGPVGWLGTDSAEFAVAIRSALINKHVLSLFAGAGIVSGSEPSREWTELENKITPYLELFA